MIKSKQFVTNHGQVAESKINNTTVSQNDSLYKQSIQNLLADKARLLAGNRHLKEQLEDAVAGLATTDGDPLDVERAEQQLADGNTKFAMEFYRADAKSKQAQGEAQLQAAATSYRRLGALAFLNNRDEALEAYVNAVRLWPGDIGAWNQLGQLREDLSCIQRRSGSGTRVFGTGD